MDGIRGVQRHLHASSPITPLNYPMVFRRGDEDFIPVPFMEPQRSLVVPVVITHDGCPDNRTVYVSKFEGCVQFLLVCRREYEDQWTIPSLNLYTAFVNEYRSRRCRFSTPDQADNEEEEVLRWNSIWDFVGLLGLKALDLAKLELCREEIAAMTMSGYQFNTVPRDALDPPPRVCLLYTSPSPRDS